MFLFLLGKSSVGEDLEHYVNDLIHNCKHEHIHNQYTRAPLDGLCKSCSQCTIRFIDGDMFHTMQARQKMSQNQPLTDEDRLPWLQTLRDHIQEAIHKKHRMVYYYNTNIKIKLHVMVCHCYYVVVIDSTIFSAMSQ